jgi:hypothetical protein
MVGQGGFGGGLPFLGRDFRGGQEWMMYNHFGGHSTDLRRELGGDCG